MGEELVEVVKQIEVAMEAQAIMFNILAIAIQA